MKILNLHIEGFGHFSNRALGPFQRPVTVFLGPNEAGKSTLLEFVRRVFFGFPDGRSSSNPYQPLAGGRHGGRVTFVDDDGETVTVQRFQGTSGGPVALTAASGGPLPEGELPRLLGHHSRDVFQNVFTFTLDDLHSDKLLSDDSVNSQLYSAGMGATKLPAAIKALESDKQSLFLKGGQKHTIILAGNELSKIDSKLAVVADNAEVYSSLTSQLKEVDEELERLSGHRQEHQSELGHQKQLESAWDDWNDLNQFEGQLAELPAIDDFPVNGVGRLETLEERIRTRQEEYDSAKEAVGEAKAKADAVVEHEAILNYSTDIRKLEQDRTSFGKSDRDLPKRKDEFEDHENALSATLKDPGPDWNQARLESFDLSLAVREDISQFRERLREAREELDRRKSDQSQKRTLWEDALEAEGKAEREFEAAVKPVSRKNGSKVLPAVCVAAGIALLALGTVLGGPAFPVGLVAGVALAAVAAYLFASGWPSTGTDTENARLSRELDGVRELARRRKSRVEESQKAAEETERALASVQGKWRKWLLARRLRDDFLPETVVELRSKVELGLTQLLNVQRWRQRIDAIQRDIDNYVAIATPLAAAFEIPLDRTESGRVAGAADRLIEMHADVEQKMGDRMDAEAAFRKAEEQLKARESDLQRAEEEMRGLLQSGGADESEDFRKRAQIVRRRTELEDERRGALGRLQRLSGPGDPLEALKKQLGETDIQAIRDQASSAKKEIDNANAHIGELSNRQGSIQKDLKNLTSEEESSKLRAERQRLLEEVRGNARDWAIRTMAQNLLKDAQAKFERERQPEVVRHAESFFKGITGGRYQTVFSPLGSSEIHVTDSSGVSKQPNQLSRGTREQLFLSLRFGLIRELGQRSETLPVIVDEALVNFDPERGLRAARAFVELSQSNQVLVFTCHPTIVDLFQKAAATLGMQEPEVIVLG
ncbi:MAG: AAA family ATPase [Acidobacteriota bacterium]|nr:AAA family ATPase [Acidobacteriota bacterium]